MARECPKCFADLTRRAKFCPRCGTDLANLPAVPDDGGLQSARRKALREVIIGWLFFVLGGVMIGAGIFFLVGSTRWLSIGFGIPIFIIGFGCLVGDSKGKAAVPAVAEDTQPDPSAGDAR